MNGVAVAVAAHRFYLCQPKCSLDSYFHFVCRTGREIKVRRQLQSSNQKREFSDIDFFLLLFGIGLINVFNACSIWLVCQLIDFNGLSSANKVQLCSCSGWMHTARGCGRRDGNPLHTFLKFVNVSVPSKLLQNLSRFRFRFRLYFDCN